jgi:hypothetical protein
MTPGVLARCRGMLFRHCDHLTLPVLKPACEQLFLTILWLRNWIIQQSIMRTPMQDEVIIKPDDFCFRLKKSIGT